MPHDKYCKCLFYQEATQYWVKATIGLPYYAKEGVVEAPAHGRYVPFDKPQDVAAACAILNSSLFYTYFIAYGDCFHLSDTLVSEFPVTHKLLMDDKLIELGHELQLSLGNNAEIKMIRTKDGLEITYAEFYVYKSKPIVDKIDMVLERYYSLTDEELDFIINYAIKYHKSQGEGNDGG